VTDEKQRPTQQISRPTSRSKSHRWFSLASRCRAALLLLFLCCSSSTHALAPPDELVSCLKDGQHNQLTTYKDFVDGKPTR
jgi:hypothetical protein